MRNVPLGDINDPEYYFELEGHECRLAALKIKDFIHTIGDATISLTYSNVEEYSNTTSKSELDYVRRIHIRHAIMDLNNAFDLLLQIPWFFYRIWESFNSTGAFFNPNKRLKDIVRNSPDWVNKAEERCLFDRVYKYLHTSSDSSLIDFSNLLDTFYKDYIRSTVKPFTIRTVSNDIKHHGSLKVKELRTPWNFTVDINGHKLNLKKLELGLEINQPFCDKGDENNTLGTIKIVYSDDLYIDIDYLSGESFRGLDYAVKNKHYSLDDLFQEAVSFQENLLSLYNSLFQIISPSLVINPRFNETDIAFPEGSSINLDKYFKPQC